MTARTVTGNTILLTGSAQASQTVTFVKRYATISGVVITQSGSTTTTTDSSGNFSKALDCPASGSTSWTLVTPDGSEFDFTLPYGDGSSVAVTTLISAATVDADAVTLLLDGYEPDLGNPGTSGHVLSSTTAGVRSWVAQSGGGASDVTDLTTTTGSTAQMLNVAGAGGLQYRTVAQVLADLRDSGALATADIGTLVQSYSAKTAAIAALTWAENSIILLTGAATASVQALAAHVITFLQSASAADARAAIGAGTGDGDLLAANNLSEVTAATARTNLAVPGLAVANTFTAAQTINVASNVTQEIVKANATQTNDLIQWQNSAGTAISGIGGDGLEIYTRRFYALKNTSGTLKWTFVYNTSFDGFSFTESAVADFRLFLKAGGNVGFTNNAPEARLHPILSDAGTTTAPNIAILAHSSTGTPAAGFGAALAFRLETSTTDNTDAGRVAVLWNTATHASRVPDMVAYLTDSAAEREIWRGRANGSAAAIGFLGATPVVRAAHIADASGDDAAAVNAILVVLENLGFIATS